ncbi:MAG: peptide chain release factor N(5)-glutamine methyltransferase, partial [Patescibacteria group bacterium]|nr:peptide chain release factor N(5)-glutamine methyltransferase [Patescibacteria group bacterium]
KGTPVAYLVGHKEFFNLDFMVDKNVLIPCPETELLVEEVLKSVPNSKFQILNSITIADVGTGCGNIAITLAKHLPLAKIYAIDISKNALKVAKKNAKKHKTDKQIIFLNKNLLELLPKKVDFIAANLPYIPTQKARLLSHSPQIALDGGKDGLKFYQSLLENAADHLRPDGKIFLEINFNQAKKIKKIIKKYFPHSEIEIKKDLAGLNRLVVISC